MTTRQYAFTEEDIKDPTQLAYLLNRLLAQVLSIKDTLDSIPDGTTYKKVIGVSGGQVTNSSIASASVAVAQFANGIRPVEILSALPAAGTQGRTVFLTTDNKLYRDTGSTWTAVVPTTDLTGTVVASQIADANIDLRKLATQLANGLSFVDARNKVLNPSFEDGSAYWEAQGTGSAAFVNGPANAKTGNFYCEVTATGSCDVHHTDNTGTVTPRFFEVRPGDVVKFGVQALKVSGSGTAQLTLVSVDKDKLNAVGHASTTTSSASYTALTGEYTVGSTDKYLRLKLTVSPSGSSVFRFDDVFLIIETPGTDLVARSVQADRIVAGAITANEIAALTILAGNIAAGAITTSKITAGAVTTNEIAANTITASNVAANTLTANEIAANAITSSELAANSVVAGKIAAAAVSTTELAADAVTAAKIQAGAIVLKRVPNLLVARKTTNLGASAAPAVARLQGLGFTVTANYSATLTQCRDYDIIILDCDAWNSNEFNTFTQQLLQDGQRVWTAGNDTDNTYFPTTSSAARAVTMHSIPTGRAAHPLCTGWTQIDDPDTGNYVTGVVGYALPIGSDTTNSSAIPFFVVPDPSGGVLLHQQHRFGVTGTDSDTFLLNAVDFMIGAAVQSGAGSLGTTYITDSAITTNKINANAVTAAKIAANTITASQIAANTITASQIAANTITASQIAAGTITATEIANSTITGGKIANTTITGSNIVNSTITATQIASSTITATEIAASTITASKLNISTLSSIAVDAGTITAGQLHNAGNNAGILLSGSLPGGWTRYLDLVSSDTTFLKHDKLSLNYDGSALFQGQLRSQIGGSSSTAVPVQLLYEAQGLTSSATTEASVGSVSIPANALQSNGDTLRVTFYYHNTGASDQAIVKFGASVLINTTGGTGPGRVEIMITRTGSATQVAKIFHIVAGVVAISTVSPTETLSGAVTLDFRAKVPGPGTDVVTFDQILVESLIT